MAAKILDGKCTMVEPVRVALCSHGTTQTTHFITMGTFRPTGSFFPAHQSDTGAPASRVLVCGVDMI
jgi:hypothetical protein